MGMTERQYQDCQFFGFPCALFQVNINTFAYLSCNSACIAELALPREVQKAAGSTLVPGAISSLMQAAGTQRSIYSSQNTQGRDQKRVEGNVPASFSSTLSPPMSILPETIRIHSRLNTPLQKQDQDLPVHTKMLSPILPNFCRVPAIPVYCSPIRPSTCLCKQNRMILRPFPQSTTWFEPKMNRPSSRRSRII